jgi:aerobic-type carbon monoxide dehydrogenase small subunit (CoxS/CutS family)
MLVESFVLRVGECANENECTLSLGVSGGYCANSQVCTILVSGQLRSMADTVPIVRFVQYLWAVSLGVWRTLCQLSGLYNICERSAYEYGGHCANCQVCTIFVSGQLRSMADTVPIVRFVPYLWALSIWVSGGYCANGQGWTIFVSGQLRSIWWKLCQYSGLYHICERSACEYLADTVSIVMFVQYLWAVSLGVSCGYCANSQVCAIFVSAQHLSIWRILCQWSGLYDICERSA